MLNTKMTEYGENSSVIRELFEYGNRRKAEIGADKVYDFSIGNPNVPCPQSITDTLIGLLAGSEPTSLHGYTSAAGDMSVRQSIASYMNRRYNLDTNADFIYMTAGAAASLTITLRALTEPGEQVIVLAPYFPEYKVFAENAGAQVREVMVRRDNFQIDFDALEEAVTEKTASIIVNSPNNPTGAVLEEETLLKLADFLRKKQEQYGRQIYLISDEPYRELVYGDRQLALPINYYENTIVCYSYSKSLSLPGERIGYILVSQKADSAKKIFAAVCGAGRSLGYVCAPSLMQKMVGQNQGVVSDIEVYAHNRKLISDIMSSCGFETVRPDGAFYIFVKSPSGDGNEFSERAKKHELLIVPSDSFGMKGYVRISYCVSSEQIKASEQAFRELAAEYGLI